MTFSDADFLGIIRVKAKLQWQTMVGQNAIYLYTEWRFKSTQLIYSLWEQILSFKSSLHFEMGENFLSAKLSSSDAILSPYIPFYHFLSITIGHNCKLKHHNILFNNPEYWDWQACKKNLRFYGPVNPMGSCQARSVYLATRLLGRLSPLSG